MNDSYGNKDIDGVTIENCLSKFSGKYINCVSCVQSTNSSDILFVTDDNTVQSISHLILLCHMGSDNVHSVKKSKIFHCKH